MCEPEYALRIFRTHFDRADFAHKRSGFTALEFGPGDSLFSALIAHAAGASKVYLVDTGAYASMRFERYRAMCEFLHERGFHVADLRRTANTAELLSSCGARYMIDGVNSLKSIPDASVDFIWSQAVLEHVRKREFGTLVHEMRRIVSDSGVCSHRIDLRDHLGGTINNRRFPSWLWETEFMARSGFYTNRIGFTEMIELFRKAGFRVSVVSVQRWSVLPTARKKLAREFQSWPEEELRVSGFDVVLQPDTTPAA